MTLPLSLRDRSFCLLDTETTGLSTEYHEITEIAALRVAPGFQIMEEVSFLIRIEGYVSAEITRLTGITNQLLAREGRPLATVMREIHAFLKGHTTHAHNASFDRRFMNAAAQRVALGAEFPLECTMPIFKRLLPGRKSYGLPNLAESLGVHGGGAHRALADCRVLLGCLEKAHPPRRVHQPRLF
jgi:DNA polymerase III subunit epsilon